jgi:hypothetical protein
MKASTWKWVAILSLGFSVLASIRIMYLLGTGNVLKNSVTAFYHAAAFGCLSLMVFIAVVLIELLSAKAEKKADKEKSSHLTETDVY